MKILVTGAGGMLGGDFCSELEKQGHEVVKTDINLIERDIEKLDVKNKNEVFSKVELHKPDIVAHLAAETDVDKCEYEIDHAYLTNTIGTLNIALACQKKNITMAYVSTAGVFDGNCAEPYTEFHQANPINVYGKTKYEGEKIVEKLLSKYFIIRAGWMMGGGERDKKFVYKILKQVKDGAKEIHVLTDKTGTPTYTLDFARNFMPLVETENYGLYHMTNKGECSRYNVARKIFEVLNIKDVNIKPVISTLYPKDSFKHFSSTKIPAPRPNSEMMRNYKLDLMGINNMRHWEEAVEEYINIHFKDKFL